MEIISDPDKILQRRLHYGDSAVRRMDICARVYAPSASLGGKLKKAMLTTLSRGVKIRYLTEIRKENLTLCSDLLAMGVSVRHLDGIQANFSVTDNEYHATEMVNVNGQIQQLICSNSSQLVTQHQSLFETLWSKAIPAITKFNEINEGEVTEVVYGLEQTSAVILRAINGVSEFAYTINEKSMPTTTVTFPEYWDAYVRKRRTHPNADLRYLTEITKENMAYVKELMKVFKVRHLEGIVGSFWVSQSEFFASTASNVSKEPACGALRSTSRVLIQEHKTLFENVWRTATPAEDRIASIETGSETPEIRVIVDPSETRDKIEEMISSASESVMLLLPSTSAFHRVERFPAVSELERIARKRKMSVHALSPMNPEIERELEARGWGYTGNGHQNILFREIRPAETVGPKVTILVVDRNRSLAIELKDDSQRRFEDAIGIATYSNSKSTVISYIAFFEKLWNESELRENAERNKRRAEMLQDILAHDIRNYNQVARLGTELLLTELTDNPGLKPIIENVLKAIDGSTLLAERASRLGKILSERNPTLSPFNLLEVVDSSLALVRKANPEKEIRHDIKIIREDGMDHTSPPAPKPPAVMADPLLDEVFANLYSNSAKHARGAEVCIETILEEKEEEEGQRAEGGLVMSKKSWWKIAVIDDGKGVGEDLKQVAFSRYSKGAKGIGLGLSIVYALVVERYNGRIEIKDRVPGDHTKGTMVEIFLPKANQATFRRK